jgi:hypothetical protein
VDASEERKNEKERKLIYIHIDQININKTPKRGIIYVRQEPRN